MREWEIGAVENIHGALPYIRFAPILALVGVGVNRIGKDQTYKICPSVLSSRSAIGYLGSYRNCLSLAVFSAFESSGGLS